MEKFLTILPVIISIAAIISAATPNKTDNKILDAILKIINILGINIGKAKNKD